MSGERNGVYLAYMHCGCVAVIISDVIHDPKWTAAEVAKCIRGGYRVQRLTEDEYQAMDVTLLMGCPHKAKTPKQGGLFGGAA